ncbi:hypothetical protein BDV33DRAFT_16939 [Aspergillus novoparasiticus]|uniref:Transmembrane protein n=1 Tax=Aspergillus novoparasiticus TaxID=986946 RepID=A0A5N6EEF9_9EURO|nr:hypothetical protein BDV33DRAFT_16939 [Aspergillus novoparasiticus]
MTIGVKCQDGNHSILSDGETRPPHDGAWNSLRWLFLILNLNFFSFLALSGTRGTHVFALSARTFTACVFALLSSFPPSLSLPPSFYILTRLTVLRLSRISLPILPSLSFHELRSFFSDTN